MLPLDIGEVRYEKDTFFLADGNADSIKIPQEYRKYIDPELEKAALSSVEDAKAKLFGVEGILNAVAMTTAIENETLSDEEIFALEAAIAKRRQAEHIDGIKSELRKE